MADPNLRSMYRDIHPDLFPKSMEISFSEDQQRQTLIYEKVDWVVEGKRQGLRYGENPDQEAALYRLVNGNLCLGEVACIEPGHFLASDLELLRSGKHPGKINITDVDAALGILRYFSDTPAAVVVKHNNPSGVARRPTLSAAYYEAHMADRIAAFGGAVALNREVDKETAELIAGEYVEVVAAPEYAAGVVDILSKRKNLRIMRIANMERLSAYVGQRVLDYSSLIDGGVIVQWSFVPRTRTVADFRPAVAEHKGTEYRVERQPSPEELEEMLFGWYVESGVTSNSVIYVKNGATVGIGTGEQDRVGVAEIARDKAYKKLAERLAWERHSRTMDALSDAEREEVNAEVAKVNGGLRDSIMVSDAFFPFRDGIDVGLKEGVRGVVQPGGSLRDFESIEACNEHGASMVFTGQRSFRH
ncbi:MAG: IMP cyclohydrolase [Spirochaetaceae bacterium]